MNVQKKELDKHKCYRLKMDKAAGPDGLSESLKTFKILLAPKLERISMAVFFSHWSVDQCQSAKKLLAV